MAAVSDHLTTCEMLVLFVTGGMIGAVAVILATSTDWLLDAASSAWDAYCDLWRGVWPWGRRP
jgi:hypothetical protein